MNKLLLAGLIGVAIGALIMLWHPWNSGFSDEDIRRCELDIHSTYWLRIKNSSPEAEIDVHMIKVANRKLEGYMKISLNTPEAKEIEMNELSYKCEATMEMNSSRYIWQCNPMASR